MNTKIFTTVAALITASALLVTYPTRILSAETMAQPAQIAIDNFTFSPATVTVPVNSTVTWVNKDDVPHVIAEDNGLFKSKALDTDDAYSYTFSKPGTYSYYCSVHPKMMGKIVVQ